jgi:hypothetical protein
MHTANFGAIIHLSATMSMTSPGLHRFLKVAFTATPHKTIFACQQNSLSHIMCMRTYCLQIRATSSEWNGVRSDRLAKQGHHEMHAARHQHRGRRGSRSASLWLFENFSLMLFMYSVCTGTHEIAADLVKRWRTKRPGRGAK